MDYEEIIEAIRQAGGGLSRDTAERAAQATLQTLAGRLPDERPGTFSRSCRPSWEIVKTCDEMSQDDAERCLAAAAAAHASYRDQLRREGGVDAQPGHACHRLQVFADRADVHVTHVPASPACR